MREPLNIPSAVIAVIGDHIQMATARAEEAHDFASEEEDSLTGQWGAFLQISPQTVTVSEGDYKGEWAWSIEYYKFRSRGPAATERLLGADGIIELKVRTGEREERKAAIFQAKNDLRRDPALVGQCLKMSTWREASFVINFRPGQYEAFEIDAVIEKRGRRPDDEVRMGLAEFLSGKFLNCLIGDTELRYDARRKVLIWRSSENTLVSTKFSTRERVRINVSSPSANRHGGSGVDMEIPITDLHKHRMNARQEDMLSVNRNSSTEELRTARAKLMRAYHPDRIDANDELLQQLANKRAQESNQAFQNLVEENRNRPE